MIAGDMTPECVLPKVAVLRVSPHLHTARVSALAGGAPWVLGKVRRKMLQRGGLGLAVTQGSMRR
eukprot:5551363-Alexandrium_andersonii.AAC.1